MQEYDLKSTRTNIFGVSHMLLSIMPKVGEVHHLSHESLHEALTTEDRIWVQIVANSNDREGP
jgi:hypothetical protein